MDFLKDQFRHCKPMLFMGEAIKLTEIAGLPIEKAPGRDAVAGMGVLHFESSESAAAIKAFAGAIAMHRFYARESDPPKV